jgi:hypothetical protein
MSALPPKADIAARYTSRWPSSPGTDFKGELTNVDLTAETGLSHTTIDKSPRLHAMVMRKIVDVIEKDLAKRIKASKKKPAKKKILPANAAAQ